MKTFVSLKLVRWTLCVLAFAAIPAGAADQGITGKKLLMKDDPPKTILISKDPTIAIAGSDPIGGADSSLTFDDSTTFMTYDLPTANWSTNSAGTILTYKNPAAEPGPTGVKILKLKAGRLKIVISDQQFPLFDGPKTFTVTLSLDGGSNTYCMTFSGTVANGKFLSKDQPAGSCGGSGSGVCCETPLNCASAVSASACSGLGGTPFSGGEVCGAAGACVAPPGDFGDCCDGVGGSEPACTSVSEVVCDALGGTFNNNAVCHPDGTCQGL